MLINAPMLFHQMKKYFNVDYSVVSGKNFVKTPIFYNDFFDMDQHIVIVDSTHVVQCVSKVNNSIIICLEPIKRLPTVGNNDLIVLNDAMSDTMAFNILTYILDIYSEWELELIDIVYNKHDFQELVDSINRILEIPISLFDANYRYIAYSKDSTNDKHMNYVDSLNHIPVETINAMYDIPEYKSTFTKKEAFLFVGDTITIGRNIFHDGNYVARLAVMVMSENDDMAYIKAILNTAAPFVENLFEMSISYTYNSSEYKTLHNYLQMIVEGEFIDRENFISVLKQIECSDDDSWQFFTLTLRNPELVMYSLSYTCFQIENFFPGAICISQSENIYCLMDISKYESLGNEALYKSFNQYMREVFLMGGASRPYRYCTIFDNTAFALRQSKYALDHLSIKRSEKMPLTFFDTYALDYLLRYGSRHLSAEQICHPAILYLMEYDRTHGTQFTYTLYVYMQNKNNAVAAAKDLFIHRSSFINRMERINALVDIDMEDPEERLYLLISFHQFYKPEI